MKLVPARAISRNRSHSSHGLQLDARRQIVRAVKPRASASVALARTTTSDKWFGVAGRNGRSAEVPTEPVALTPMRSQPREKRPGPRWRAQWWGERRQHPQCFKTELHQCLAHMFESGGARGALGADVAVADVRGAAPARWRRPVRSGRASSRTHRNPRARSRSVVFFFQQHQPHSSHQWQDHAQEFFGARKRARPGQPATWPQASTTAPGRDRMTTYREPSSPHPSQRGVAPTNQ